MKIIFKKNTHTHIHNEAFIVFRSLRQLGVGTENTQSTHAFFLWSYNYSKAFAYRFCIPYFFRSRFNSVVSPDLYFAFSQLISTRPFMSVESGFLNGRFLYVITKSIVFGVPAISSISLWFFFHACPSSYTVILITSARYSQTTSVFVWHTICSHLIVWFFWATVLVRGF